MKTIDIVPERVGSIFTAQEIITAWAEGKTFKQSYTGNVISIKDAGALAKSGYTSITIWYTNRKDDILTGRHVVPLKADNVVSIDRHSNNYKQNKKHG